MDNLTHTLVGAALAETGLKKHTRLAMATLVLAANAPDVDIVSYAWGEPVALSFRRGWTHGVLAMVLLPVVVTGVMLAWDWAAGAVGGGQRRTGADPGGQGRSQRVRPKVVFALAALGVATHPFLDWLNTYGMRWLMPFDGRWFYGDTLFIIDPWLWLVLGGAVFLTRSRRWWALTSWAALAALTSALIMASDIVPVAAQVGWLIGILAIVGARAGVGPPRARNARRLATAAVALAAGYVIAMAVAGRAAARSARSELTSTGHGPVEHMMAGPLPADPFGRDIVASVPGAYWTGSFRWRRDLRLIAGRAPIPQPPSDPVVLAALATPEARAFVGWARFPFVEVDTTLTGYSVHVLDARYTRARRTGFGSLVVELDLDLRPRRNQPARDESRRP